MSEINQTIFDFAKSEESRFDFPITVREDYDWSMKEHITEAVIYKNSQTMSGKNKGKSDEKPIKNIIRPILNTQYRLEGFDVKDVALFVDDKDFYHLSFFIKKYHDDKYAIENKLDTFIDDLVESYVDFGGVLTEKTNQVKPEVIPLQTIAFCDQTNILAGPIGFKYYLSPDQLKEKTEIGWGDEKNGATISIDDLVEFSKKEKSTETRRNETPGVYIEVYKIHGVLPKIYLTDNADDTGKYALQLQIISFYKTETGDKIGVTLFRKELSESLLKFLARDKIYNRALGFGGVEELVESQVWTNYSEIRKKQLLDACAKIVHLTDDETFYNRNQSLKNIENNQVLVVGEGKTVRQMDTYPRTMALFEQAINDWEAHAMRMGTTTEPLLGEPAPSGTPFRAQERQVIEGKGIHEYRKGKIAEFVAEHYQDWIISDIAREVMKDQEFLAELDFDEMKQIADNVMIRESNRYIVEQILNGKLPKDEEVEAIKTRTRESFMKSNKKFIKILKGEMKKAPIKVKVNIAGKQKDLSGITDKLVNIVRQVLAAPQMLENPQLAGIFNQILEYSGFSPIDFGSFKSPQLSTKMPIPQMSPIKEEMMV